MMQLWKNLLTAKGFLYAPRHFSSKPPREECIRVVPAVCTAKHMHLAECTLHSDKKELEAMERSKLEIKKRFISMWENPECCVEHCVLPPRYDALYYKVSDKQKRKYQKTWLDCRTEKKPVIVCCYEDLDLPPPEKRRRGAKPETACEHIPICPESKGRCSRVVLPGCRTSRVPPKCNIVQRPKICKKICAPYPAFSECLPKRKKPSRSVECKCLEVPPICVLYEELAKGIIKIAKKPKTE